MTSTFFIFLLALAFYSVFGMLFYDSYAPPFLAVALICLFVALKKTWTELRAVRELLEPNKEEDDENSDFEETDETDESEETDEATEPEELDETKE